MWICVIPLPSWPSLVEVTQCLLVVVVGVFLFFIYLFYGKRFIRKVKSDELLSPDLKGVEAVTTSASSSSELLGGFLVCLLQKMDREMQMLYH